MNATIKTIALALGLSLANQVQAQEPASASIIENKNYLAKMITTANSNLMKVYIGNIANQRLVLALKDAQGHSLFTKMVYKNEPQAYVKLNLDELADGIYTVEISDKNSKSSKSFKKGTEVIVTRPVETLVAVN